MAITGCTAATEHKIYSGSTETVHPEINTLEWSGDTLVIIPSIRCRSVKLGGQGVNS